MSPPDLVLGALLLLTGFLAVRLRNAVHAALALAANFVFVGVAYMLLDARFLGWIQIIVYAGAIMVLFVFVIMLLYAAQAEVGVDPLPALRPVAASIGVLGFLALLYAFLGVKPPVAPDAARAALGGGTAEQLGPVLWQTWLYGVLLLALLLFVATVAAVAILRPEKGGGR